MKALLHTGLQVEWGDALGTLPWCLVPVGGKPLVEYWLEWASVLGIVDVRLVLGDGAGDVESFCGDGSRWGLQISYGFLKQGVDPVAFLRRSPAQWEDGLLYIAGPVFPQRLPDVAGEEDVPRPVADVGGTWLLPSEAGVNTCFLSFEKDAVRAFIAGQPRVGSGAWADMGIDPFVLDSIQSYYDLNMRLVRGEVSRYVRPGFGGGDGAYIGSNVIVPPSVELRPPLIIGNDCRIHPMAVIGPDAVIGNGVIVDRQTEVSGSVVLDDTYLGRNLDITERVVSGNRLILPADGTVVDIEDPWLLAHLQVQAPLGDSARAAVGWLAAVALVILQVVPFAVLYALLRVFGGGSYTFSQRLVAHSRVRRLPVWSATKRCKSLNRLFSGLSLDVFPLLALAVPGYLWLCGHAPLRPEHDATMLKRLRRYYPAAIHYGRLRSDAGSEQSATAADALYYERYRSLSEDLRILFRFLFGRLLKMLSNV